MRCNCKQTELRAEAGAEWRAALREKRQRSRHRQREKQRQGRRRRHTGGGGIQSGASYLSQGFEDNLGSSPGQLGQ